MQKKQTSVNASDEMPQDKMICEFEEGTPNTHEVVESTNIMLSIKTDTERALEIILGADEPRTVLMSNLDTISAGQESEEPILVKKAREFRKGLDYIMNKEE